MQCIPKVSEILMWVAFLWQNSFDILVLVYNVAEHFLIKCYQVFFSTSCELQTAKCLGQCPFKNEKSLFFFAVHVSLFHLFLQAFVIRIQESLKPLFVHLGL